MKMLNFIFSLSMGDNEDQQEFPTPENVPFQSIIHELAKKGRFSISDVAVASLGGAALTGSELIKSAKEIHELYGNRYKIFTRGTDGFSD